MRGGARPGSGRKKGSKVIDKEMAREELRRMVVAKFGPLIEAQIANAIGINYFVGREKKTGKFVELKQSQVESIIRGQESEYERIEVWEKQPSTQAFSDLMNRTLDRPKEQEQEHKLTGDLVVRWQQ